MTVTQLRRTGGVATRSTTGFSGRRTTGAGFDGAGPIAKEDDSVIRTAARTEMGLRESSHSAPSAHEAPAERRPIPAPPVADHLTGPVQPLTQVDEEEDEFLPDFLR